MIPDTEIQKVYKENKITIPYKQMGISGILLNFIKQEIDICSLQIV